MTEKKRKAYMLLLSLLLVFDVAFVIYVLRIFIK